MRTLVMADIHANAPAFEAVLKSAGACDRTVFLGDVANFGPFPVQCIERLRELEPIAVLGNHDLSIASDTPSTHPWERWAQERLTPEHRRWLAAAPVSVILDGHILLIHGIYDGSVKYDILRNTPNEDIRRAFAPVIPEGVDEVWFGHYHYDIVREINGVTYRCFRPVGQARDKDPKASYYIYEDGVLTHHRVEYDVEKTVAAFLESGVYTDRPDIRRQFVNLLRLGFDAELLKKDLAQEKKNEEAIT